MAEFQHWFTGGLIGLLVLLAFVVLTKLLDGTIRTNGMLSSQTGGNVDPERLLVMIGTLMAGFGYLAYGLDVGAKTGKLPEFPTEAVTALGGSNLLYITRKYLKLSGGGK